MSTLKNLVMVCWGCRGTKFVKTGPVEWRCAHCDCSKVMMIPQDRL